MGQCKLCGKEVADGVEFCEDCQKDMEQIDLDADLDNFDIDLDDLDLPELSGDLNDIDLEFVLEDSNNNLENPQISIRDRDADRFEDETDEDSSVQAEGSAVDISEAFDMPEIPKEDLSEPIISEQIEETEELPKLAEELPGVDGAEEIETTEINTDVDLPELPEDILPDVEALQEETSPEETLQEEAVASEESNEEMGLSDDVLAELLNGSEDTTTDNVNDGMDLSGLLPEDLMDEVNNMPPEEALVELPSEEDSMSSVGVDLGLDDASLAEPIDLAMMEELPDAEEMVEAAKPKISIWKRLFGNIKDEKWEKQKAKEQKAEEERLAKEAAKKEKEAEAASAEGGEEGAEGEAALDPKEAKKAEKLAKKEEKARKKAEKKAARQQQKELAEAEDDDPGRINRVGATIVFVFFGLVAATVVAGTNMFDYNTSVKNAKTYFKEDEYSAAYDELQGLTIKEKDQELYDKIQMVMYVDKELNSYKNYTSIRLYPEALHSLLKGLEKYDNHLNDAMDLDVTEDYDKLRNRILSELKNEYNMNEKEAYKLINDTDQEDYSEKVIAVANE